MEIQGALTIELFATLYLSKTLHFNGAECRPASLAFGLLACEIHSELSESVVLVLSVAKESWLASVCSGRTSRLSGKDLDTRVESV